MNSIAEYLRERYGPWGWMGQRAHDAEGINRQLPLDLIISCDHGRELPFFFREEDVFSVEKMKGRRKDWSNEDLSASMKGPLGREIREKWFSSGKPASLLCYRSIKSLESPASGARIFAAAERLKRRFDNKILLYRNMDKLGLPRIDSIIDTPGKRSFSELRKEFGMPFVVQFPYGSSGSSTHIVRTEKEYNTIRKKYPSSSAVLRRFINGFSLNVNAVVSGPPGQTRVLCCYPSVQITGLNECSNSRSAYCGNDYTSSALLDKDIMREMKSQVGIAGRWMASAGYRGVFGMDFVVKENSVYTVEINPRFQNSTSMHNTLSGMKGSGEKAVFFLHIAEFLRDKDEKMRAFAEKFTEEELMDPVRGSQIVMHNRMKEGIVTGSCEPGIYSLREGRLVHIKISTSIADCVSSSEVLITCGVPRKNIEVAPNAPLCKIQFLGPALDSSNLKRFTPEAKRMIAEVYKKLSVRETQKAASRSI